MREVIFSCDNCTYVLSDNKVFKDHISIEFIDFGIAYKEGSGNWCINNSLHGVKKFCDRDCMKEWIDDINLGGLL